MWGLLLLAQRQLLSPSRLRAWWPSQVGRRRVALLGVGALAVIILLVGTIVLVRSFSEPGRQPSHRAAIYEVAIRMFLEKPLLGHGLFTFGRGLAEGQSMPPDTAHSHAHNIPLQVAAEQGIVGLFVLAITVIVLIRAMQCNWRAAGGGSRIMTEGAIASVTAFGVHQLTDIPAMMPAVALSGLLALALAVAPLSPAPVLRWQKRASPLGIAALWLLLLGTGYWSAGVYREYVAVLRDGSRSHNFRVAAERLQSVIEADPSLALYYLEQGELFGLAAYGGDLQAAREGVAAYDRFIAIEPSYAVAWANKAALHWQLGEREQAIEAMQRAVELAPRSWELAFNLGMYLEAAGETDSAREIYERVFFTLYPCLPTPPEWEETPLRREVLASGRVTCTDETPNDTSDYVQSAIEALSTGDRAAAQSWLNQAQRAADTRQDQAWLHLGRARLAQFDGDAAAVEAELDTARALLQRGFLDNDYGEGINIAHSQYLRTAIQRLFLPQVYYPTDDPLLLRLIEET